MCPLDEVATGLWRFTVTRNGIPPTMTAYALRDGEDTILVDRLVSGEAEPLLAALDQIVRGRVRILVTTPSTCAAPRFCGGAGSTCTRSRSSGTSTAPRGSTTARLSGRCAAARRSTTACARTRSDGRGAPRSRSSCRRTAPWPSATPCSRSTGSCAYRRGIATSPHWYEQRFLPTLGVLTGLDVERVLVMHGEPVLRDGARAQGASLTRSPWSRSSLY